MLLILLPLPPSLFPISKSDARAIRSRIIECFERASYPDLPSATKARLLSFVVVGGGPTSVEFASELHDFLRKDVHRWYPDLEDLVRKLKRLGGAAGRQAGREGEIVWISKPALTTFHPPFSGFRDVGGGLQSHSRYL